MNIHDVIMMVQILSQFNRLLHLLDTYGPVYALEITDISQDLRSVDRKTLNGSFALLVGNEPDGVELSTLLCVDWIIHIPMIGSKESLNVGQAAAIAMRHSMNQ